MSNKSKESLVVIFVILVLVILAGLVAHQLYKDAQKEPVVKPVVTDIETSKQIKSYTEGSDIQTLEPQELFCMYRHLYAMSTASNVAVPLFDSQDKPIKCKVERRK